MSEAIQTFPLHKSPGPDGLVIEMLKCTKDVFTPKLVVLFNHIKSGVFPEAWSKAILVAIHKSGPKDDLNNYRRISLINVMCKIFTVLATQQPLYYEEQAGFRKGDGTVDNIFSLFNICQKYLSRKGGRFYTGFIDFSKAFDSVSHLLLWVQLLKRGIHGDILIILKSM